jgi:hypothetical protein
MPFSAGPNIAARPNLVFEYDLGDVQNSYKGIPVVNCATDLTSGYNVTVTEVTDGSIPPPFGGMRVYKFVTANNYNLYRQGGYYDGGGFAGSNPRPLILGRTSPSNFTTVGTGKYRFGMYVRGHASNSAGAGLAIDIGDRNAVSTTVGTSSTWQLIQTDDSAGINDSSYPYDFFDIGADFNMTFYVAGYGIWRNIGTVDSLPALQGYPQGTQYITYGQTRSVTEGLLDISGYNRSINLSNVSFTSTGQMTFDGTDDYIPSIGTAVVPAGSAPYTVSVWVNRGRNNVGYEELLAQWTYANSGNSFFFGFNNSNVRFSDSWNDVSVSGAGNTNVWMNLVGVNTGANAYIYLNGALAATKGSALTYTGTGPLLMGRQGELAGEYFLGRMNNVQIYNSALSAQEVLRNYNQLKGRFNLP